jgi:methionyl-tRNA formyltransferase
MDHTMVEGGMKRIFFWGSKPLGLKCLRLLMELVGDDRSNSKIVGVCTSERDIRKRREGASDIKEFAEKRGIPVFTERDNIPCGGDLGISVGFPHKISAEMLERFALGVINTHLGPLPHYRGSKTLIHAIVNGEKEFGASLHYLDAGLDTGDVITNRWMDLSPEHSIHDATQVLEKVAFDMFREYLPEMLQFKAIAATPQSVLEEREGITPKTYTRKSIQSLYKLSWSWPPERIHRHIRALPAGEQLPYIEYNGQRIFMTMDSKGKLAHE